MSISGQTNELIIYAMCQRVRADNLTIFYCQKQIEVSFSCVCPLIDNEFRHKIVTAAVDARDDSRMDPQLP